MTTLGPKLSTFSAFRTPGTGFQVAFNAHSLTVNTDAIIIPAPGWITRLGGAMASVSGTSQVAFGLWLIDPALHTPSTLLARTNAITVNTTAQNWEAPIAWVAPSIGGLQTALRLAPGTRVAAGYAVLGAGVKIFNVASGNRFLWTKANGTGLPLTPFAATGGFDLPELYGFYAEFTPSTKPTVAQTLPLAGATISTATPTLEANVTDAETALGDALANYNLAVRRQSDGVQVDNQTFAARTDEITSNHISRVYDGATLLAGVPYEWTVAAQDLTGLYSDFSAWRAFTIASTAITDSTGGTPTGKVDGDSSQISFAAHWWHTANLAADRVQVRILNDTQTVVVKEGPETIKTIAAASSSPGTAFTVSPTEAGIGALPYGTSFYWQVRARGSNGVWSAYSTPVAFRTNAIPTTPVLISPAAGAFSSALPALVIASTDADADDVPLTDVVFEYEITQLLTGQIRTAVAGSYNSALGRATYQTTSSTVPAEGPYSWRARAKDTSAGTAGISPYSAAQIVNFGAGPVVTITAPTSGSTIGTAAPHITWTSNDIQTAFQVSLYNVNANGTRGALVTSTPKVVSANLFYDVPAGSLTNNTQYELVVSSWDDGDFQGSSTLRFTVAFLVVAPLTGVAGSVQAMAGDVEPTTPVLVWNATTYPTIMSATGQFTAYIVKRWQTALGRAATEVTLIEITNPAQLTYRDYHAPPGVALQYALFQRVTRQDGGQVDSTEVLVDNITVTLTTPVIVNVGDPATLRFPVMWLAAGLTMSKKRRRSTYQTWGADGVPSVAEAPGAQNLRDFSFTIMADQYGSLSSHLDTIEAVMDAAGPVCIRDSRRKFFMSIVNYSAKRSNSVGKMDVSVSTEEVSYREGV